jgi:tetratricopeptide (TPR) repeat protein
LAEKALTLHQTHAEARQLAQDYGFLAEVALEQSGWKQANQLTQQALQLLSNIQNRKPNDWALCTFLLARFQAQLGQIKEAIANLEQVRQNCNPQYDPQLYIDSLGELRLLYFQQREYLKAFEIKQEQFQIEHQYGFRAFIGAGYLQPKRSSVNPAVGEVEPQGTIAQEIAVSSREQDVKRLIERISRDDCKLTVIHGQSGVGKSSILQGGLVPALHQQAIGERDVLPVLLRVYKDWVGALDAEFSPPNPPC